MAARFTASVGLSPVEAAGRASSTMAIHRWQDSNQGCLVGLTLLRLESGPPVALLLSIY